MKKSILNKMKENKENKLGLSCAKLRASLALSCFDRSLLSMIDWCYLAYESNFGAVILSVLKILFGRFSLIGLVW